MTPQPCANAQGPKKSTLPQTPSVVGVHLERDPRVSTWSRNQLRTHTGSRERLARSVLTLMLDGTDHL